MSTYTVSDIDETITTEAQAGPPMTNPQRAWIETLWADKVHPDWTDLPPVETVTKAQASALIDRLKLYPWKSQVKGTTTTTTTVAPEPAPSPVTEAGMYKVGTAIYKVQVALYGSGNLYAKRLTVHRECPGHEAGPNDPMGRETYCDGTCAQAEISVTFEYEPGAIRKITADDRLSREDAKKFGLVYGVCCRCGRTLTDETSIKNGIGPVCIEKEGWA